MKKPMKQLFPRILALALCVLLASCGAGAVSQTVPASEATSTPPSASEPPKTVVAVTILPQKAFAEAVCGDLAQVLTLVPAGYSPGNYEPTPAQAEDLSRASVYFTIGVPSEKNNILPKASAALKTVDLAEAVRAVYPDRTFESGGRDPHIWLSPRRAQVMVQKIAEEMAALDPQNKEQYEQNAEHYIKELQSIDQQLAEIFAPFNDRKFFVFHPAFGYLADDYGLLMYSLEQNGKEATPQHLQEMIDLAKAEGARAVFCQAEIDDKQSEAFAAEIGAFSVLLTPLSPDYTDSLLDMAHKITEALR